MSVTSSFRAAKASGAVLFVTALLGGAPACDDANPNETGQDPANSCATPPVLENDGYCEACAFSPTAQPSTCKAPRTVNACCTWVTPPSTPLARGVGLVRYSAADPSLNLACSSAAPVPAASRTAPMKGFVRLFSSGNDSKGVQVEIFRENDDGSLGDAIAASSSVVTDETKEAKKEDLLAKCPDGGCTFRSYTFDGAVPTETRLVVKTSDASGAATAWAPFYEYVYFSTADVVGDAIVFDPTAIASTDRSTIFAAAGALAMKQERGLLLGEVHDCGDVRVSGAMADIDASRDGDMVYFGDDEKNPLPDPSRTSSGTSKLGMFAALNVATGVPIRVSAIGLANGQTTLLGNQTVQAFAGSVTAIRLRGRRPWQR